MHHLDQNHSVCFHFYAMYSVAETIFKMKLVTKCTDTLTFNIAHVEHNATLHGHTMFKVIA